MNKRRATLILVFALCLSSMQGQDMIRLRGGLNLSTISPGGYLATNDDKSEFKPGIQLGITVEKKQSEHFSLETGLIFSSKGDKYTGDGYDSYYPDRNYYYYSSSYPSNSYPSGSYMYELDPQSVKEVYNINLLYLEIPLAGKISYNLGAIKIYGTFGPYLSIGLYGKAIYEIITDGETTSKESIKIDWGWDKNKVRPIDLALTAGTGIEINKMQFGINYNWGILNIAHYKTLGKDIENRTLSLFTAYKF